MLSTFLILTKLCSSLPGLLEEGRRRLRCNSFLLVSTFPFPNNQDVGVGGCQLPDGFSTRSLSRLPYSPSASDAQQDFHKKTWSCPKTSPECDLFLKKYVVMCRLQLKHWGLWDGTVHLPLNRHSDFLSLLFYKILWTFASFCKNMALEANFFLYLYSIV